MLPPFNTLKTLFEYENLSLTEAQYKKFDTYAEMLVDWNTRMNLTAITDPDGVAIKHFLDSSLLLKYCEIPENARVIDVGTGAGFPGIPLKILREDISLTLLDSLNKRINFLTAVNDALEFSTECIHSRAEDGAKKPDLREKFDVATARAVAAMPVLCEYCLPYVKVGGFFAALKGPTEDIDAAKPAIKLLGGKIDRRERYLLPNGDERMLVFVKKISQTPTKFPRNSGQISKKSL